LHSKNKLGTSLLLKVSVALATIAALAMGTTQASASFEQPEAGTLVAQTSAVLAMPAVSTNGSGESLVVYTSADQDGAVFGRIMKADGSPKVDEFLIADQLGSIAGGAYAPAVTWNETNSEWLVLVQLQVGPQGPNRVYATDAYRVSETGSLVGTSLRLPVDSITPLSDLGENPVVGVRHTLARVSWSEDHQLYLFVWGVNTATDQGPLKLVGRFADANLAPIAGSEYTFEISEFATSDSIARNIASLGYSSERGEWLVAFGKANSSTLFARSIGIEALQSARTPVGSSVFSITDSLPGTSGNVPGDVLWIESEDAWMATWANNVLGDDLQAVARFIDVTGSGAQASLTPRAANVVISDLDTTSDELSALSVDPTVYAITQLHGFSLVHDDATDTLYAAGHLSLRENPDTTNTFFRRAVSWSHDLDSGVSSKPGGLASPDHRDAGSLINSYRPKLSFGGGVLANVYQNSPTDSSAPREIRFITTTLSPQTTETVTDTQAPVGYSGPILSGLPGDGIAVTAGETISLAGSELADISKVTINDLSADIVSLNQNQIQLKVPIDLEAGSYDLVLTSGQGVLTIQGAIRVEAGAVDATISKGQWTRAEINEDGNISFVKMYAKNPVNAGKIQFMVNGREIAWVRATDETDPKLRTRSNGELYLVRTVTLQPGKNALEIYIDGERVWRAAYTLR
jgi:hypothetical protein